MTFQKGKYGGSVSGAVLRGERNRHLAGALKGQKMLTYLTSPEHNAVFHVLDANGKALPGAEESKESKTWTGTLTTSGDTVVVVGGTRGNASYTLKVEVLPAE